MKGRQSYSDTDNVADPKVYSKVGGPRRKANQDKVLYI